MVALAAMVNTRQNWRDSAEIGGLHSAQWYRVATLKPQLAPEVSVSVQQVRGSKWAIFSRQGISKQVRINNSAYQIVGRCNGKQSLNDIWQYLLENQTHDMPAQADILPLIGRLISEGYLVCNDWPNVEATVEQYQKRQRKERKQYLNPMAPRIPLGSPDRLLTRLDWLGKAIFSSAGLVIWLAMMILACVVTLNQLDAIYSSLDLWSGNSHYWLLGLLCYPWIKLIHEVAHGLAVRRWGGTVNEAGIGFLMLFPAPYVDASDANRFERSYQRAWVSAAGIAAELSLAALAILVFCATEAGLIHDIALTTAMIGSVSTVFFNANPLVRFDGYYLATDVLQLPNLGQRSQRYWQQLWQRRLMRLPALPMQFSEREQFWLAFYSPASWIYRIVLISWLATWLGSYSKAIGVLILLTGGFWLIVTPIWRLVRSPGRMHASLSDRMLAYSRLASIALALIIFLLIPVPDRTLVQGVVWSADHALVRARGSGFIVQETLAQSSPVVAGQTALTLSDPELMAELQQLRDRQVGLNTAWHNSLRTDVSSARSKQEQIVQAKARETHLMDQIERLQVKSNKAGNLLLVEPANDLNGRYVVQGELLAVVVDDSPIHIRAALSQAQAIRFKTDAQSAESFAPTVQIRLSPHDSHVFEGVLVNNLPAAINVLPNAALARKNGGAIAVHIGDEETLRPVEPTYLIDVRANNTTSDPKPRAGSRAWIRIDFGHASLIKQFSHYLRQTISSKLALQWD